jgi:hypothetical protein
LEFLSLTTNRALSDAFVAVFIPSLNCSSLREMHLSAIDMTHRSARHLVSYISSQRCRLHTLKCNGNSLGYKGVKAIIRAIESSNYSLTHVELYSNQLAERQVSLSDTGSDSDSDPNPTHLDAWKEAESQIQHILSRNRRLKRETEKQAFGLLRYSRSLLLPSTSAYSPFKALPTELQHYILSFLAPTLSPSQRIAVLTYGSDVNTLPKLLPNIWSLNSGGCVPDPLSLGFSQFGMTNGCSRGKCMGSGNSLVCRREQERQSWLETMGCAAYDSG